MDDFGNFLDSMYKAPFKKNQWGNWNYRTPEGRDPFQNTGLANPLSRGASYELTPSGNVQVRDTPGPTMSYGAGTTSALQHMANNMLDTTGGFPGEWTSRGFSAAMPGGGMGGGLNNPMLQALKRDTAVTQRAADEQRAANLSQGRQIADKAGRWSARMMADSAGQAGAFSGEADRLMRQSTGFKSDIERMMAKQTDPRALYSGAMNTLKSGMAEGDRAVSQMNKAASQMGQMAEQDASSAAYAMKRSTESQKQAAIGQAAGTYNKSQILELSQAMDQEGMAQRQQVVTQIRSDYSRRETDMKAQAAQLTAANANLKMQGANQMGSLNQQLRGFQQDNIQNRMAVQAAMNASSELARTYRQMASDIYNSGVLKAADLDMAGQNAMAQVIRQNPYSVVSWVQGLMSLQGANAASTVA